MTWVEWFAALGNVVTVVGLPFAIGVFILEKRRERNAEADALNQRLNDDYSRFLTLVLDNADLKLFQEYDENETLSAEQRERKRVLFAMLISVFEQSYITLYEREMGRQATRRWLSWEDDMRDWCRRPDFRDALPRLLEGEDDDFSAHILAMAEHESQNRGPLPPPRP